MPDPKDVRADLRRRLEAWRDYQEGRLVYSPFRMSGGDLKTVLALLDSPKDVGARLADALEWLEGVSMPDGRERALWAVRDACALLDSPTAESQTVLDHIARGVAGTPHSKVDGDGFVRVSGLVYSDACAYVDGRAAPPYEGSVWQQRWSALILRLAAIRLSDGTTGDECATIDSVVQVMQGIEELHPAPYEGEPVAWTDAEELQRLKDGLVGEIWADPPHPDPTTVVALYLVPAPPKTEDTR